MSGGIDKLIVLTDKIEGPFLDLAREEGSARYGYGNVIDLRQTRYNFPVVLYCDGRHNGKHKIEVVGVARLGLRRARQILKIIVGHLSAARIYRIDLCTDIFGLWVWDLAEVVCVSRTQNFKIYNNRGGASFYVQNSAQKTIVLYDKVKQLASKGDPLADAFGSGEHLTRIEVQLKGRGVPFKKIHHLHRYAAIDLLGGLHFRQLKRLQDDARPLHLLAAGRLRGLIHKYGLQAVKKRFSSSQWAYFEKTLFRVLKAEEIPDLRVRLKRSIEDWLENRIRFPRGRKGQRKVGVLEDVCRVIG
jgi:hypothetical protein